MRAYVGVDWSANHAVCATAAEKGKPKNIRGVKPRLASVRDLVDRVRERHAEADEVHVILESGGCGWARLFVAAGMIVHVVDAKQAKRFAESLSSSGAKADQRDARTLVEMLRSPAHCPPVWERTADADALAALSTAREQSSKERTRAVQQLRAALREHMPLVDQQLSMDTAWALRFLDGVPTPVHAAALSYAELERLTKRCGTSRRQALWEAIQQTEAPWMTEALATVEALRVRGLVQRVELASKQLATIDAELDKLTAHLPVRQLAESVDGIGLQLATLLVEFAFGDTDVSNRDQAGVQLGAAPVFMGSGKHRNGEPKGRAVMRRAANSRARRGSYLLGRLAQQNLQWAAAMYADGRARGQSAATAYRRIARSLLRILTAMIRTGQPYDEARYVQALKAKGVSWAASL